MSEEEKLLIISTYGPENPEKCLFGFIAANAALAMDIPTTIFLMGPGVELAKDGVAKTVPQYEGMPNLATLVDSFLEQGGDFKLCGPCCVHRGIADSDIIKGAAIGGASKLVDLSMTRKVITF